jgi:hypothetical protein
MDREAHNNRSWIIGKRWSVSGKGSAVLHDADRNDEDPYGWSGLLKTGSGLTVTSKQTAVTPQDKVF